MLRDSFVSLVEKVMNPKIIGEIDESNIQKLAPVSGQSLTHPSSHQPSISPASHQPCKVTLDLLQRSMVVVQCRVTKIHICVNQDRAESSAPKSMQKVEYNIRLFA